MRDTIFELSRALRTKKISSVELCELYLKAIERENPKLNAYVHVFYDSARRDAERADRLIKEGKGGLLTGIPVAVKDNICTEGELTTCCSAILKGYKPPYSATVWERLRAQGAVMLGKTNMDEFAMGSSSESSVYGAPKNPIDATRVTGGSSGGSAAAVCARLAPYALGSDTGGSVRQPAAFCGTVGFKPTYGEVSRYGLIAYASSLDQIGPLTSSVKDAAAVFSAIRGKDERDMTSFDGEKERELDPDVKGLKIGIAEQFFEGLEGGVKACVESAAKRYESAGAELIKVSLPSLGYTLPVYYIIACAEASSNLGRYDGIRYGFRAENYSSVEDMIIKTRTLGFGKEVQRRIMLGTYVLSSGYFDAYYKKACALRERIKSEFSQIFQKCDVLLTPSSPITAFPAGLERLNPAEAYLADIYTVSANAAGLPAISVPCGSDGGLPVGLQIMGERFSDYKVLSAAYFAQVDGICPDYGVKGGVEL